ncbi:DNA gyrase inhibitor YacG [Novipirellula galeiformis]|uniref:DNA gyrase inhibitor YacG n=1 Tax=Novipirellula galeiformis TaxID=2528004 RepID=UPI0028F3EA1C|nr:DNA gyrase inhibitor YacG [Novipirellula galeiformis]
MMNKKSNPIDHPVKKMTCPTCSRRFLIDETPTPPFCCKRCQMIDLGRWLDEDIGLPFEGKPEETPVEFRDHPQ